MFCFSCLIVNYLLIKKVLLEEAIEISKDTLLNNTENTE